jgi:hypothetical protein
MGSPSWEMAQNLAPTGRTQSMLRAAQARNSLAQPQLRAAYSSLRLQSRVLRSQSGNGIWRGQDSGVSIVASTQIKMHTWRAVEGRNCDPLLDCSHRYDVFDG